MPSHGTTSQRGYGTAHKRLRKQYEPKVAAGLITCWRCDQRIAPHQPWDLGHDDDDRSQYRGPEHVACNRATGGRRLQLTGPPVDTSRLW